MPRETDGKSAFGVYALSLGNRLLLRLPLLQIVAHIFPQNFGHFAVVFEARHLEFLMLFVVREEGHPLIQHDFGGSTHGVIVSHICSLIKGCVCNSFRVLISHYHGIFALSKPGRLIIQLPTENASCGRYGTSHGQSVPLLRYPSVAKKRHFAPSAR